MAKKRDNTPRIKPPAPQVRGGNGVDVDLIRWMLSLTPLERLRAGQQFANSILRLRARRVSQGEFPDGPRILFATIFMNDPLGAAGLRFQP